MNSFEFKDCWCTFTDSTALLCFGLSWCLFKVVRLAFGGKRKPTAKPQIFFNPFCGEILQVRCYAPIPDFKSCFGIVTEDGRAVDSQ